MLQTKTFKIILGTFVLMILHNSCTTFYTTNIQDLTSYEEGSNIYALPRTCIKVEFTTVRTLHLAGPYAYKAKDLLKLDGVIQSDKISWEISNISMGPCNEPDPDQFFSVKELFTSHVRSEILELSKAGLIINPDAYSFSDSETNIKVNNKINPYSFDQPSVNFDELRNQYFNKIPYPTDFVDNTTPLKEAEIIADEILHNRNSVEKLFINDDEIFPIGEAASEGVNYFKQKELSLLTLFTGITVYDTIKRYFYVCPNAKESIQRHTLCKFSEEDGFMDKNNDEGKALVMVVKDLDATQHLDNLLLPDNSPTKDNILFYRVPDKAEITLLQGSIPIAEVQLPINQLGTVVPYFIKKTIF